MCDHNCGRAPQLPPIQVSDAERRRFIAGLAGLPLAAVLALPQLSRAAAARTELVSIPTAGGRASAALALPRAQPAPAILLIHEWWGLNRQIKAVAAEFAELGYVALAVDLYGRPPVSDAAAARELMQQVDAAAATDELVRWIDWLRAHPAGNGKAATIGWCFGGGWSLNASLAAPVDATVIYYGNVRVEAAKLRKLAGPALGHFATRDEWINRAMVDEFARAMKAAGKRFQAHWYDADHAFANPTSARYDAPDAMLAWRRTTEFLRNHLM